MRTFLRRESCSSLVVPHTIISSCELAHPGRFAITEATSAWNTSLAECIPKGRRLNRYRPKGVPKVRRSALSSSTLTCQYPDEASILEKYWAPAISERISSAVGKRWCCRLIALLRGRGSRQILRSPFGLDTMTRALTQSVGFSTGSMISKSTMRCSSFLSLGLRAQGIFLTGEITGLTSSLISMWWTRGRQPISPKQSENSSWTGVVDWMFLEIWYTCLIRLSLTDVLSPRIGTESESTTMNRTFTVRPLSFSLPIHLPETGMGVPL